MSLAERLQKQIAKDGPLSVADYMAQALGDPDYGYYMGKDPLGLGGDFVTSPEISQIFGELIGIWSAECWHQLGEAPMDVVELGPGRGTLMKDWLRASCRVNGFHSAIDVHMVEMSPVLRQIQQRTLMESHPRIHWHEKLPETDKPLLIVANEFFDALPIRQFVATASGFCERMVDYDHDTQQFHFSLADERRSLPGDFPNIKGGELEAGTVVEVCPLAQRIMHDIASHIATKGGAMLAIDYGFEHKQGTAATGDTLQAVFEHEFHDALIAPGKADITAHVDFTTLGDIAKLAGAKVSPVLTQREFLIKMGGKVRAEQLCQHAADKTQQQRVMQGFERLISPKDMGELFKVMAVTSPALTAPVLGG